MSEQPNIRIVRLLVYEGPVDEVMEMIHHSLPNGVKKFNDRATVFAYTLGALPDALHTILSTTDEEDS